MDKDRSELAFTDYKKAYSHEQALIEADRCLFCTDAPCIKACPTHIDIPQFIRKIATNNIRGSAKTIFESNILGMSCARVCPVEESCVGACVYNKMKIPPIQIGKLQRYSTDQAFEQDWHFFSAGKDSGKHVALIGSGPASIACAHELRCYGHRVTIYEKKNYVGGLNTAGIAPYKMHASRSLDEINWILKIGGIDIKTKVSVGEDISIEDLESKYDALFFGIGLGEDTSLNLPGENLSGIYGAVSWIERMKLSQISIQGIKRCVVIGGGNTAIDAVREALGLGIPHVSLIYRGSQKQMRGYAHEYQAAQLEGAYAEWEVMPLLFVGKDKVEQVKCIRTDQTKSPIPGTEFMLDADLVLIAIGQLKLIQLLAKLKGITLDKGRIVTDNRGFTGRKGIFAGGDCCNGGKEVVNAVAEGKTAAAAIHDYLTQGVEFHD
ncbi:TPA: NAD(P)-dependent oxidoreductase [Legionella pneumophila]